MKALFDEHTTFTLATFPEATTLSSIVKLLHEVSEVRFAVLSHESIQEISEEYADCVMCLFDSAARVGVTGELFEQAFREKLAKNKSRTWVKNDDNTYSHVKPE